MEPTNHQDQNEILTLAELEEELSRPSERDIAFLGALEGDIAILGAGGKMGPSLARLCRRGSDAAGTKRRIFAVSRRATTVPGVESIACDLLDRQQVAALPDFPNVLYLAGRKFGSTESPELTWAANVLVPSIVAERFRDSRGGGVLHWQCLPLPQTGGGRRERVRCTHAGGRVRAIVPRPRTRV
jgi:hypothetical protein